jgi:hypothetical protein
MTIHAMTNCKVHTDITHAVTAALVLAFGATSHVQADPQGTVSLTPAFDPSSAVAMAPAVPDHGAHPGARPHALTEGLGDFVDGAGSIAFFGSLLRAANLGDLLDLSGVYTLLVPVDSAFSGLTGQQISDLIHDPESLRSLVTAHIVPGRVFATDLTQEGATLPISGARIDPNPAGRPQVDGMSLIRTALAGPIVVHVVDGLLQRPEPGDA